MAQLPDPRTYAGVEENPIARLANYSAVELSELRAAVNKAIAESRDPESILRSGASQAATERVWSALESWLDEAGPDQSLRTRLFAMPLLLVTGGATGTIPGVVPEPAELIDVLRRRQALGPLEQFSLSASLCDMSGISGGALLHLRESGRLRQTAAKMEPIDVAPAAVPVSTSGELVHLRFMIGVAVSRADAPGIAETASQVSAWGMEFARALSAQLCPPGMSLLAVPRAPTSLLRARHRGHFAREELALTLGLSRVLRNCRARAGEPDAIVAACNDGTIRLMLRSKFEPDVEEELHWRLHPLDRLDAIEQSIETLLADCRVEHVTWRSSLREVGAPTQQ